MRIIFFVLSLFLLSSNHTTWSFTVLPESPRSIAVRHWIESPLHKPASAPSPIRETIHFEKKPSQFSHDDDHEKKIPTRYALDVCCGIGDSTQQLINRLPPAWKVLGIDEDPLKISLAKKKHPSLSFLAGNLAMFPSSSFDRIQVYTGRMLLIDKKKELASEVSRILTPGGTLELFDFCPTHALVDEIMCLEEDVRDQYYRGWKSHDPRYHHSLFEERLDGRGYTIVDNGIIRAIFVKSQ